MNRKKVLSKFIKTYFALLGSLLFSVQLLAQEVGLQLYSLRHQMDADLPKAIAQIEKWGINAVEGGGNLYDYPISDFKALLDKHHVQVVSVDTNYEELRDNPIAVAYKAKLYGARFATFYWIPHQNPFSADYAKEAVKIMNTAGALLKKNGVTLQYHPHGYELIPYEGGTVLDYMLNNVTEAKFQMDVFWIKQGGQDPAELLARYPGKFTSLHLKDRLPGTDESVGWQADVESNVVLGTGDIGIDKIVSVARRQGVRYFFLEDESSKVLMQIPKSIDYLNSLTR
jgi:sugar phosphate isomerase/epimerase